MARQRIIRPEFFADERLAACSPHARLLFAGLWGLADKRGRLRDQPPVIHGAVFPFEPTLDVDHMLDDLQAAGSILRYVVEDRKFIQVKNFERYQNPHPKEAESLIPAAPLHYRAEPRKATAEPGGIRSFVPSKPSDTTPSDPVVPPSPAGGDSRPPILVAWSREACDAWIGRFGGTAPGGQIGKALKPLVDRHGWSEVATAWRSYLTQTDAEYASPSRFAATYGRWSGTAPPGTARESSADVLRAAVMGGLKGK